MIVGGVTQLPSEEKVAQFKKILADGLKFVRDVYAKDILAVGTGPLFPLAKDGFGKGHTNYLAYGAFDQKNGGDPLLTPGVITGDLSKVKKLDPKKIKESVKHAWYKEAPPAHPYEGAQEVDRDKADAYSFIKAPRYDGKPFEVGPLARMLVMQNKDLMDLVAKGAQPGVVARHASRAIESLMIADAMEKWIDELETAMKKPGFKIHDGDHWDVPEKGEGAGFYDAPRGALGHWIQVEGKKTKRYQAVVPSTWKRLPQGRSGRARPVRGVPHRDPHPGSGEPHQRGAGDPLLRSVPRLCDSHDPARHERGKEVRRGSHAGNLTERLVVPANQRGTPWFEP